MSQVIRPDDLETGVMFEVSALGTVPLGQTSAIIDVLAIQKQIRDLYLNYQKPSGAQPLPSCRLVVSNRGLAVTDAPTGPQDRTPSAETLYNIPSVVFAAAVRFLIVGKKERDFRCAFEAIDSEGPPPNVAKGKNDLYVVIDKKWKHLVKVTSHPAICACVIQRMTGVKAHELHAFVCESDLQARDVIFCLTSALKNFQTKDAPPAPVSSSAIYGHGPYDFPPQRGIAEPGMGGMRNEAEHMMMSQQQQQQARPLGPPEGVYGFQGHPDHMMGYRGADVMAKPSGMRPDLSGPVGGQWDPRTQDGRPLPGSVEGQQGSDWLSNQRDQLMRNFTNDQRKNEPLHSQAEQGVYDQQRGVYDVHPPRGIYDPLPSRGIYDSQPPKGIYDTQPATYEYRPPQNQGEPPRETYAPGPPVDVYAARRDIYDPQVGSRAQGDPGGGNLYAPMRNPLSGSSERVFDDPRRGQQDLPKSNYDAPQRMAGDSYGESEYSTKGFVLPRVQVKNYDAGETPSNARNELNQGGGEYVARPVSVGYDSGKMQKPTSSPYPSLERSQSPVPQVKSKAQPPAPLAKSRPSPTSPTTDANPGLRSSGGGCGPGPMKPEPESSGLVAAKKFRGVKVFPTIMLRGNQAAAAAAAAEDDAETGDLRSTKQQQPNGNGPERQAVNRNRSYPDATDDHHGQDRRKKDDEIESAFGGLAVDPARAGRNPSNDFEQSLGYLP